MREVLLIPAKVPGPRIGTVLEKMRYGHLVAIYLSHLFMSLNIFSFFTFRMDLIPALKYLSLVEMTDGLRAPRETQKIEFRGNCVTLG